MANKGSNSKLGILRQRRGLTLRQLSAKSGVSVTSLFHYEQGAFPKIDKAVKIRKVLKVPLGKIWPVAA